MPVHGFPGARAAIAAGLLAAAPFSLAVPPDVTVLSEAPQASDEALAEMRGRFQARGRIVQFGVRMVTSWRTPRGEKLEAAADLRIGRLDSRSPTIQFEPTVSIVSQHAGGDSGSGSSSGNSGSSGHSGSSGNGGSGGNGANSGSVQAGAGHNTTVGVVQVIQVAGDQNSVKQTASVVVSSEPVLNGSGGGAQLAPREETRASASGSSVSVSLRRDELSVEAKVPDVGTAVQRLRGAALHGKGAAGLLQSSTVAGDFQVIDSAVMLRMQMVPSAARGLGLSRSLLLQGIRPVGAF